MICMARLRIIAQRFRRELFANIRCKMTDSRDHIEVTASHNRQDLICPAVVTEVSQLSQTVRGITIKVDNPQFYFKAGQWLDIFIPGVEEIGGFSISSSPCKLGKLREIDLAVKNAKKAPAHWFHTQCRVGSTLDVRAGGDFYLETTHNRCDNLLLIGGGVGINPLASILQYCADLNRAGDPIAPQKVLLVYSACKEDELLFRDKFLSISEELPGVQCRYFITRETCRNTKLSSENSRIKANHIEDALTWLGKDVTSYICGPLAMINDMVTILESLNISKDKLKYEKWY
uniref:Oxidoreductase NAD-binding domain-containing protein 1 n=1 Tax=Strigamia maritima TaxID=126957 RepID=T1JML7_STRMM